MEKLIITLSMLGNVPTKDKNPATPVTPMEIADTLEECCALGVSVAHIHARDDQQRPTHSRDVYQAILDEIFRRRINVITQLSTGVRGGDNSAESRGQMLDLDCEMGSLATGSSNFLTMVNANSPDLITAMATKMLENGLKPEIEAFDVSMIDNAAYLANKGILQAPLHFNLVMNVPGSIKGTPKNLLYMVESLPPASTWTVSGIGRSQISMLAMAMILGGHVRTGLEDVLQMPDGRPATNRLLVEQLLALAHVLGREIATPDEARKIMGLPQRLAG